MLILGDNRLGTKIYLMLDSKNNKLVLFISQCSKCEIKDSCLRL